MLRAAQGCSKVREIKARVASLPVPTLKTLPTLKIPVPKIHRREPFPLLTKNMNKLKDKISCRLNVNGN